MRLATISHSHIALRQQLFFQEVARQGHEVLMIAPGEWGNLKAQGYEKRFAEGNEVLMVIPGKWASLETHKPEFVTSGGAEPGSFALKTCRHVGDNIYAYKLLGAKELVEEFDPDWLYVQAEPGSRVVADVFLSGWKAKKRALFTWENIRLAGTDSLHKYDLVVCGNPDAEALVKPYNPNTLLLLQVGVDTDHFAQRPVERTINVAYIGRSVPEKGLPYLGQAYPGVYVQEWKDFRELPWWYSQVKVVVAYSQDVPWWREQAPNFVVLESLSCGSKAVISDTAAMKFWLEGCPGVVMVEGHEQLDMNLRADRVVALREGIQKALDLEVGDKGRRWVIERFSNPVIAKKLLKVLNE